LVPSRTSRIVHISVPIEDMTDLIAAIFMNTDAVAAVLENRARQLNDIERVELQTVVMFGDAMAEMLSTAIGVDREKIEERVKALVEGANSAITVDPDEVLVHANRSGNEMDFLIKSLFGDKYG
jgi:hypothetical protein